MHKETICYRNLAKYFADVVRELVDNGQKDEAKDFADHGNMIIKAIGLKPDLMKTIIVFNLSRKARQQAIVLSGHRLTETTAEYFLKRGF